ncbi:GrpB family protein [Heyndrickxia acidicola]|uniref:GrpB family protein n=1 Tax=Heyndrickxia acidicola TaxID=209389 RepID=A0ABU6MJN6_9BACI|nr:GrpB family protein [Heyndrickxia acidicola]MED1203265.1 GrpB family protein [Heyndrickxia acidicola]
MTKPIVVISEYNPDWECQFQYEKKRIHGVLGDRIIQIEHIGSTSIKGLSAKPIIDMMAGVPDLEAVPDLISSLNEIGYEYVPKPEIVDRRFFRKGLWGQGTCHLHICEYGGSEWFEKLLFRDYLRLNPLLAKEYELLKQELAVTYKFDRPAYTKNKEPFIRRVVALAREELG